ncbi:MAG: hypothetical protein OQJ99_06460 [Rhodospirillales bacterium]|nr:hypothetical protein [Rhodospirillales bacterium]MCW8862241.1 hypothetical protein [Rhodospirillales bacterium]
MSLDLYLDGAFDYETYALLAFQPELHPDYDRTIGALTGEAPQPDTPRDFIRHWEERLAYERKYGARDESTINRIRRIVDVLRIIDTPITELVA